MQKNKLNLHIYGIHLLNPYKTVVSHLKAQKCKTVKWLQWHANSMVFKVTWNRLKIPKEKFE